MYQPPPQITDFGQIWKRWTYGFWVIVDRLLDAVVVDEKSNIVTSTAALSTTATDGFLYIPTCAGTPTGTPTSKTGTVPIVFDTTNNKLYIYDGSWISTTLT